MLASKRGGASTRKHHKRWKGRSDSKSRHPFHYLCTKRQSTTNATVSDNTEQLNVWPRGPHWQVHKLGGACVGNAELIKEACEHIVCGDEQNSSIFLVLSAMGGKPKVTDLLLNAVDLAAKRSDSYSQNLEIVREKYVDAGKALLGDDLVEEFKSKMDEDIRDLRTMLRGMEVAGTATDAFRDFVVGHGEIWCAQLASLTLRRMGVDSKWMDAREALVVTPTSDGASVDIQYDLSNARLDRWYERHGGLGKESERRRPEAANGVEGKREVIVATGFIATDLEQRPTTLRRNGSDYSATAFGALLEAESITIWTDVDGVFSADPRKVPGAVPLEKLSFNEAWELSYFGANVLHPRTTVPAMKMNVPITLRNFFNRSSAGTQIGNDPRPFDEAAAANAATRHQKGNQLVKGIATIDNMSLISVEGTGMVGVQGTASEIFTAVRRAGCNVVMISQASSEHSLCFAVRDGEADDAVDAVSDAFREAISAGRISSVEKISNCTVLAAVGQNMCHTRGVSAKVFDALARAGVNVKAIAQGSSEYNITVVIEGYDSDRALAAVHSRFYGEETSIAVGLVGHGLIGSKFVSQLHWQEESLRTRFGIGASLVSIAGSKQMRIHDKGIDLDRWQEEVADGQATDMEEFTDALMASSHPHKIIVDCTTSGEVAGRYARWLERGIHVVTPNKKANSGDLAQYEDIFRGVSHSGSQYRYEATVGAGLPVISTLQMLRNTGDSVRKVEGIFSGTLSYIFNEWDTDLSFSGIVSDAKERGFTEPDPREDLNGQDVARKVVILAREAGLPLSIDDLKVESLVPGELQNIGSAEEFMQKLPDYDGVFMHRLTSAKSDAKVLRYVGGVDVAEGEAYVRLEALEKDHPFAGLKGSDNIVSFETERYSPPGQPLVVRGPGAGADVTAGGVFSDLLRVASFLGAPEI